MEANSNEAIREALVKIKDINDRRPHDAAGYEINDIIDAALAAPPRNCDVGTAEEQYDRWSRFCQYRNAPLSQNRSCFGCPVYDAMRNCKSTCELIWAQMLYAEGGAK